MDESKLYKDDDPVKAFMFIQQERIEKLEALVQELQRGPYSKKWCILGLSIEDLTRLANVEHNLYVLYNCKNISFSAPNIILHIQFKDYKNKQFVRDMVLDRDIPNRRSSTCRLCVERL